MFARESGPSRGQSVNLGRIGLDQPRIWPGRPFPVPLRSVRPAGRSGDGRAVVSGWSPWSRVLTPNLRLGSVPADLNSGDRDLPSSGTLFSSTRERFVRRVQARLIHLRQSRRAQSPDQRIARSSGGFDGWCGLMRLMVRWGVVGAENRHPQARPSPPAGQRHGPAVARGGSILDRHPDRQRRRRERTHLHSRRNHPDLGRQLRPHHRLGPRRGRYGPRGLPDTGRRSRPPPGGNARPQRLLPSALPLSIGTGISSGA